MLNEESCKQIHLRWKIVQDLKRVKKSVIAFLTSFRFSLERCHEKVLFYESKIEQCLKKVAHIGRFLFGGRFLCKRRL